MSRDTANNQIVLDDPDALAVTALRTKSVHAREVLVEAAWPGHTADEVHGWARDAARLPGGAHLPQGADPHHLGQLARVLALQTGSDDDVRAARTLLEALVASGRTDDLPPHAVQILLHLRCRDGDVEGCQALLEHPHVPDDVAASVRADLARPRTPGEDPGHWLSLLDAALHSDQIAALRLDPARGSAAFDQLTTESMVRADGPDDPLVTVVMSSYHPGPPLLTAVRSVMEQTWRNLELIVVDDASGPEAQEWLDRAERIDPRVRVVRKAVNGGTYRARNTALRQARGSYVTTLDSDDWLHPQALATFVRTLEGDRSLMAVRSMGARVTPDLELVRLGYRHRAVAAPTLLFRVDPVVSRVGFFDPTRKGADTEYARRIQAAFGRRTVATVDECLLLLRSGETLSSSEFSRMWRHGARHAYKSLYARWHEQIAAGAPAFLDPGAPRAFPEPRRWRRDLDPDLPAPDHLDLVLAGDWRRYGGPQRSMMEEIRAARAAGLRVGIMHLEALRFATTKDLPLCAPVLEAVQRREVEWVQIDERVSIDTLMVRYPLVLQHPPHAPEAVRPRRLLIVANQAPLEPDGSDQRYVVTDVTARARELFGVDPEWVPQGPVIRQVLREQDPAIRMVEWDNPGLIDVDEWSVRGERAPGADGPVVVGRYSRDHELKFPATHADFLQAYDLGPGHRVRLMGAGATWKRLARQAGLPEDMAVPPEWELVRFGSVEPREFLAGLDFFLYQDHPGRHEAFGRVLLEAAASGVLVIAHPKHRLVFGDVLDYAEPAQAKALIAAYVADPQRYAARVHQIQELVRQRYSHASFVDRLGLTGGPTDASAPAPAGPPVGLHRVALRTDTDATRADVLELRIATRLSIPSVDRMRNALATPADELVGDAALEAAREVPEITSARLLPRRDVAH
ncbi:glycosyltransferase [Ornithinimicrobium panacihumi]|uniref:glycosyltransferase n=1 Tax=Ornithinimicrobium panacihumi TaxID=2008449 RepID=UPI003F8A23F4